MVEALKGVWHEIFSFKFSFMNQFLPRPWAYVHFFIFFTITSITLYTYGLNFCLFFIFSCRQADIGSTVLFPVSLSKTQVKKFIGGAVDIGEQFFGDAVDTGNYFWLFLTGIGDTGDELLWR